MKIGDVRWRRVVALSLVDTQVFFLRARIALLVGIALLVANLVASQPARGLMLLAFTLAGIGGLAGPMVVVSDRRSGALEFFAGLPMSRVELAAGRLVPTVIAATLGSWGGLLAYWLSTVVSGKGLPMSIILPVGVIGGAILFWIAAILIPFFARLPAVVAIAIPSGSVLLLSKLGTGNGILGKTSAPIMSVLNRGISELAMFLWLFGAWIIMALLLLLVAELVGRAVQRRGPPTDRAKAVLERLCAPRPDVSR